MRIDPSRLKGDSRRLRDPASAFRPLVISAILWRRLDTPGHDACWLEELEGGWRLEGTAVFLHAGLPARLTYRVECDSMWRTRRGRVDGPVGGERIEASIVRTTEGKWTLNGELVEGLEPCLDLDLGFTPATNLLTLRRVALSVGHSADVPVALLDDSVKKLELLPQRYERRTDETYWYESPTAGYRAILDVRPDGFVRRYPGLWEEA